MAGTASAQESIRSDRNDPRSTCGLDTLPGETEEPCFDDEMNSDEVVASGQREDRQVSQTREERDQVVQLGRGICSASRC